MYFILTTVLRIEFPKRQSGIVLTREPQTRELFTIAFTFLPLTEN
jgi:hypothetical protein